MENSWNPRWFWIEKTFGAQETTFSSLCLNDPEWSKIPKVIEIEWSNDRYSAIKCVKVQYVTCIVSDQIPQTALVWSLGNPPTAKGTWCHLGSQWHWFHGEPNQPAATIDRGQLSVYIWPFVGFGSHDGIHFGFARWETRIGSKKGWPHHWPSDCFFYCSTWPNLTILGWYPVWTDLHLRTLIAGSVEVQDIVLMGERTAARGHNTQTLL